MYKRCCPDSSLAWLSPDPTTVPGIYCGQARKMWWINESGHSIDERHRPLGPRSARWACALVPTASFRLSRGYYTLFSLPPWVSQACRSHHRSFCFLETADISLSPECRSLILPYTRSDLQMYDGRHRQDITLLGRLIGQLSLSCGFFQFISSLFLLKDLHLSTLVSSLSKTINDRS